MFRRCENTKIMACCICLANNFTDGIMLDTGSPWLQYYIFCIGITISADDIPRKLCGECQIKLKNFTNFKEMAHRSANLWQSFINNEEKHIVIDVQQKKENEYNLFSDCMDIDETFCEEAECDKEVDIKFLNQTIKTDVFNENEDIKWNISDIKVKEEYTDDNKHDEKFGNGTFSYEYGEDKSNCTDNKKIKRKKTLKPEKIKNSKKEVAPSRDCGLCEKTFTEDEELYHHLIVHGTNNDLCCKLCDFNGGDFADMVSHRFTHASKEFKVQFRCHLCDKRFAVQKRLQFHYRSLHLNKKGGKCTLCSKQFINYKKWANHERLHVTEGFICDICGKRFLFRHQIIDHLKYHNEENSFICDVCGRGFKRNNNLKQHIQTRHDSSNVKCTHCNKMFKNTMSLKVHLRELTCEKPYKCDVCLKCFRAPSLLKSHMVWHQDIRSFACGECGLTYKSKQGLKTHMLKHTGHLPHKCVQCTRCFATSSQLKTHTSLHTGVRRHKCPQCPRSFHGRKDVLAHIDKCRNVKFNSKSKNTDITPSIS
ncbi:hypothetical protein evm_002759 [Chilo suppressalis]|nr:hypothetical protein evm_002759 [Chilo suppressalis]